MSVTDVETRIAKLGIAGESSVIMVSAAAADLDA